MSYNGSGVYTLPGAQLANGEVVSATENNQFRNDVATALNTAWTRDGQAPATANIPMGNHKFTGLAAGTGNGDSVRFEQLPSATNKLDLTTSVTGTLPVANGGSGVATLTGIIKGNGTSAFTAASAGTDYLAPTAIGTTVQAYSANLDAYAANSPSMRNRIINGDMRIDQRNAGASVAITTSEPYVTDRFKGYASQSSKLTMQQSSTAPAGFVNSLLCSSLSAYTVGSGEVFKLAQVIEGLNVADLGWGAAGAASVTLSFWVRCSLTGTFGGALRNSADNYSYPFSYTINAANTWEQKSITIAGPTSGTWLTNNGAGIKVGFGLGCGSSVSGTAGSWSANYYESATGATSVVGTNGATFYITGVQLEKGSTATSFDYRPYGTELALCQRYCYQALGRDTGSTSSDWAGIGASLTSTFQVTPIQVPVTMRSATGQSVVLTSTASNYAALNGAGNPVAAGSIALDTPSVRCPVISVGVASGLTAGQTGGLYTSNSSYKIFITSEL